MAADGVLELRVLERWEGSAGAVRIALGYLDGADLPPWTPGAHLDLIHPDKARPYSLTGDASRRDCYELAVLRPAGGGSVRVHESLTQGSTVRVMGPYNDFPLTASPEYLFIAGGIGITPIYAMVIAASRAGAGWRVVYGGRRRADLAFVDELSALAALDERRRLDIMPEDEVGLLPLTELLRHPRPEVAIYTCGPEGLLDAVEAAAAGWPAEALHIERFTVRS